MDVVRVLTIIFDILSLTSILVLLVLGLGIIVGMMGIFNFAHGELVLLGALTPFVVVQLGASVWLGILLAPFTVGLFGLLIERTVIRRLYGLPLTALLVTWGLGLSIRETVRLILGQSTRSVPYPLPGSLSVGGLVLPEWRLLVVGLTIVVVAGSYLVLSRSNLGLQIRATLENADLVRASGIRPSSLYALTFAFGSALAGLAGALIVPLTSLYPELGLTYLVRSFLGLMVGGIGSFDGPVAGATIMGISSGALPWFVPPVQADLIVFAVAILLLRLRPQGLRGIAQ
jgi:branched-chain amino acid transport system permease protein